LKREPNNSSSKESTQMSLLKKDISRDGNAVVVVSHSQQATNTPLFQLWFMEVDVEYK
jgi:hypothetical protein